MGEIIILDKTKANTLLSLGFRYTVRKIVDKEAYVFIQTPEIMKELNSKFAKNDFCINNTVCF